MAVPQLAWILPFCPPEGTSDNREGSFVSRLFHFVQARLMQRVMHLLREEEGERLACIVFDGLNVANKARHGDEPLLDKCTAACTLVRGPACTCTAVHYDHPCLCRVHVHFGDVRTPGGRFECVCR